MENSEINLAIIGSRTFNDYIYARDKILDILITNNYFVSKIISGGAIGADQIAEIFAAEFYIPVDIIKPDWNLGRNAGFLRNTTIIDKSDIIIAFWDGKSKGTLDSINKAKNSNKNIFVFKYNEEKFSENKILNKSLF